MKMMFYSIVPWAADFYNAQERSSHPIKMSETRPFFFPLQSNIELIDSFRVLYSPYVEDLECFIFVTSFGFQTSKKNRKTD